MYVLGILSRKIDSAEQVLVISSPWRHGCVVGTRNHTSALLLPFAPPTHRDQAEETPFQRMYT